MEFKRGLTIVIPTYNRRERLIKQLTSLFCQIDNLKDVTLIVADNHSDYNVKKSIETAFPADVSAMVEIVTRPYNMGMGLGISMPFAYCKTQWLWILSDDDEVIGDINQIKKDIDKYSDVSLLKYNNISGQKQDEVLLTGIYDFLDYYESPKHTAGDLLFLSNSIFNVEVLYPYVNNAFVWAGTLYGHIIPLLIGLAAEKDRIKCLMRDFDLVKYLTPENPIQPEKALRYALAFATIDDLVFFGENSDTMLHRRICRIIQRGTGFFTIASAIISTNNKREAKHQFYRIYNTFFDYGLKNRIIKIIFMFSQLLNLNLFEVFKKIGIKE